MRFFIVLIAALALASTAQASPKSQFLKQKVVEHRTATWYWQDIRLAPRTQSAGHEQKTNSVKYLRWLAKKWYARRVVAKFKTLAIPHYDEWICIHKYEGAWNDPNAPYYGGLQMDMSFQRAHGWDALQRWGTADNWHPYTQMWVAERAHRTRGFYPWPNTARYCGLI